MQMQERLSSAVYTEPGFDRLYLERPLTLGQLVLEQLRDSCFHREFQSFPGKTKSFTLLYALSGNATLTLNGHTSRFEGRQYVLAEPGAGLQLHCSPECAIRVAALQFRPVSSARSLFAGLGSGRAKSENLPVVRTDNGALEGRLLGLLRELEEGDPFSRMMSESFLQQIVVHLCRNTEGERSSEQKIGGFNRKELAYRAVRYMDRYLNQIRVLTDIAAALGYSHSRLSHVFRTEMGESMQSYWTRKRIMKAMQLLQSGRTSITSVADLLQYQSIHSFSKAFKKIAGIAPTEFKALYGPLQKAAKGGRS